ncbi:VOC family protein [Profundibacter sp.]
MNMVSFIVIYARDLEKSLQFYTALGLSFKQEQHGAGPKHHSCQMGGAGVGDIPV